MSFIDVQPSSVHLSTAETHLTHSRFAHSVKTYVVHLVCSVKAPVHLSRDLRRAINLKLAINFGMLCVFVPTMCMVIHVVFTCVIRVIIYSLACGFLHLQRFSF